MSADNRERSGCFAGIFLMEDRGVPAPVRAAAAPHLCRLCSPVSPSLLAPLRQEGQLEADPGEPS